MSQTPAAVIPDFQFSSFTGKTFTNKDLAKTKLLLFVFFDVTCNHCQHAIEQISNHYNELKQTSVYLVTLDEKDAANKFIQQHGSSLQGKNNVVMLRDSQSQFITRFKPKKYPSVFLYSQNKKLVLYSDEQEHLSQFFKIIKAQTVGTGKKRN